MASALDNWTQYTAPLDGLAKHSIVCIGAGEQSGSWRGFRGRRLEHFALVLVSTGSGWYVDATAPSGVSVEGPHAIWLTPGVEHGYGPGPAGWSEHWLIFGGRGAAAYSEIGVTSRLIPVTPLVDDIDDVLTHFSTLRESIQDPSIVGQLETALLMQRIILDVIHLRRGFGRLPQQVDLLHRLAMQAFENMSIPERARRLGLSVEELRERVAQQTGSTPLEYVLDRRVARSCELLTSSTDSIARIGRQVGYTDPAYFSRLFSHRVGVSPRIFREQESRNPPI